jgi:putative flippase GtrA
MKTPSQKTEPQDAVNKPKSSFIPAEVFSRILNAVIELLKGPKRYQLLKWLGAGLAFMGINTLLLYLLVDRLGLLVIIATLIAAEACTLLRFVVNHYWVFGQRNPSLSDCAQYHIANAGAFFIWWVLANLLTALGMHYLLAGVVAVGGSTLVSIGTNFFWIWRKRS